MYRGYVKLWRKLEDSTITTHGLKTIGLLTMLLIKSNHTEKKWKEEQVDPGQFITSIHHLSSIANESPKVIRRILKLLQKNNFINIEIRANKWHKITICKWSTYQNIEIEQGKQRANRGHNKGQTEGTTEGTQLKNDKNVKNIKNDKNIYIEVVEDLNNILKTTYKPTTKETQSLINARIKEGFSLDNFKTVHRKMAQKWGTNNDMRQYLRPQTLYSSKFESYLNMPNDLDRDVNSYTKNQLASLEKLRRFNEKHAQPENV